MKNTLTLKLIESNDKPQVGDLIQHSQQGIKIYKGDFMFGKLIKPIAISDEEIKVGDKYFDPIGDFIFNCDSSDEFEETEESHRIQLKKIELLPNHFSPTIKQAIVDGLLKDGDTIEIDWFSYTNEYKNINQQEPILDTEGYAHISISKESKVMYSEDEVEILLGEFADYFDNPNYKNRPITGDSIREWFNKRKKK